MIDSKEMYYIDFDKLFENYADKYFSEHEAEYSSPEEFAKRDLDKVYHTWATSAQIALGGLSPSEFFNRIPNDELIDILKGSCVGELNPCSLLFDRIATEPSLLDGLIELANETNDEKLLAVTISLIAEIGGAPDEFFLGMLDRDIDIELKEHCVEELSERAERVKDKLLVRAETEDDVGMLEMYAEILTFCEAGDDRILELLRKLLEIDPQLPYIAALMGRYGDDRACEDLYPLLDTCTFTQFLEIRNAIEELGGTVDEHYRDFSDDPLYRTIKGNNN